MCDGQCTQPSPALLMPATWGDALGAVTSLSCTLSRAHNDKDLEMLSRAMLMLRRAVSELEMFVDAEETE